MQTLQRRAVSVVSSAATTIASSSSDRPDRGGTRVDALDRAKVMKKEKEAAERSDDEKPVKRTLSRRGTRRNRKYIEHGPEGEAQAGVGRRKTVKW